MAKAFVDIKGAKAIVRRMKLLGDKPAKKVGRESVRAASREYSKHVRRRAKKDFDRTGFFYKSITDVQRSYQGGHVQWGGIGSNTREDPITGEVPAFIAHILEGGARPHVIKADFKAKVLSDINSPTASEDELGVFGTRAQHPGFAGGEFMKRTFSQNSQAALDRYIRTAERGIDREVRKLVRNVR